MTDGEERARAEPEEPRRNPPSANPAAPDEPGPGDTNAGWVIIAQLVAGMIIYGGLGRLIGQWVGAPRITTLVGVLVGLVLALALVIYRYGRS